MARVKPQLFLIPGAGSFDTKEQFYAYLKIRPLVSKKNKKHWRVWLAKKLEKKFEVHIVDMPNKDWSDYSAWKIWFERHFVYLDKSKKVPCVLVGNSQGATFILKYLSENKFPKHLSQVHLLCPAIDDKLKTLEKMGTFKLDFSKLKTLVPQTDAIYIYHSKDDPVVPFHHSVRLAKMVPSATFLTFSNRGHFSVSTFPELYKNIISFTK